MADVLVGGPDRPQRPGRRRLAAAAVVAGVAAAVLLRREDPPPAPPVATPTFEIPAASPTTSPGPAAPCPAPATGLVIPPVRSGWTAESCDREAVTGPWTAIVRRPDGSLGRHGAVVTFPVDEPTGGRAVQVAGAAARIDAGALTWPIAGAYARVRGDLTEAELVGIAEGTSVGGGRPVLRLPPGLSTVWTGPYRPPVVSQVRYGTTDLKEGAALGDGLTYTGAASGGGIEDQLYARHARRAGSVRGTPAVISSVYGGNATIAWETAPGTVAFVGYSGSSRPGREVPALLRLAARTRVLPHPQWTATRPTVLDQVNEPS